MLEIELKNRLKNRVKNRVEKDMVFILFFGYMFIMCVYWLCLNFVE